MAHVLKKVNMIYTQKHKGGILVERKWGQEKICIKYKEQADYLLFMHIINSEYCNGINLIYKCKR